MINQTLPPMLYCQLPSSFLSCQQPSTFVVSLCTSFQNCHDSTIVEDSKDSNTKVQKILKQNLVQSQLKKAPKKRLSIKKQQKSDEFIELSNYLPKKNFFKNSYLSFAVHKLFNFISNQKLSKKYVCQIIKIYDEQSEIQSLQKLFYQSNQDIMKQIVNSTTITKLRELWMGQFIYKKPLSIQNIQLFTSLYRSLCKIFFEKYYGLFLLRYKKIQKPIIKIHLKMRRCILKNLQNPEDFVCYDGF